MEDGPPNGRADGRAGKWTNRTNGASEVDEKDCRGMVWMVWMGLCYDMI